MAQRTFEKILADAKTLPPDEQRQLRAKLDEWLTPVPPPLTEVEFEHQLVAQGILSPIPPPITDVTPYRRRMRIHVHGTPLSATILEERGEWRCPSWRAVR